MVEKNIQVQSNRLRGILTERRITHSEMARIINISENAFSMKINGYRAWQVREIMVITKFLHYMDPSEVFPELYVAYGLQV